MLPRLKSNLQIWPQFIATSWIKNGNIGEFAQEGVDEKELKEVFGELGPGRPSAGRALVDRQDADTSDGHSSY